MICRAKVLYPLVFLASFLGGQGLIAQEWADRDDGIGPLTNRPAVVAQHRFTHAAMGTEFKIVLYGGDSALAKAAADSAFLRIDDIERTLSDYDPNSELSMLSRSAGSGDWVSVSDDLWDVVSLSRHWSTRTQGAFDLTVGPITRLWRWANRRGQTVPPDRASAVMIAVGYEKLELDPKRRSVRLTQGGMELDAGGIGKGFAADAALAVLRARGFGQALVDAGGDLGLGEAPPGRMGWQISIPDLDPAGHRVERTMPVSRVAVATSGDQFRHTMGEDGLRRSHVIDPRTGRSVTSQRIVTVFAVSAAVADLLASAASVMTRPELKELQNGIEAATLIRVLEPSGDQTGWTLHIYRSVRSLQPQ